MDSEFKSDFDYCLHHFSLHYVKNVEVEKNIAINILIYGYLWTVYIYKHPEFRIFFYKTFTHILLPAVL